MEENLANNSQEQIDNQPKENNQIVPTGKVYDYSVLHGSGEDNETIADVVELTNTPAIMPSYDQFKENYPDLSEQDLTELYNNTTRSFQAYQSQNFDPQRSFIRNFNKLPYATVYEQLGWPTQPKPDAPNIPMSTEFAIGPGFWDNPLQVSHPDQIAESLGYFLDDEGNWKENKRINRLGRFLSRSMNPDPNSPLEYYWKQVGIGEGLISPETIRTFLGPRNLSTPTIASLVNPRAFLAESVGLTATATGVLLRSATVLGNELLGIKDRDTVDDWFTTKISNGLTNVGAYLTHQNMDELDSMFSSGTGFSWGLYGGVGQLMSMVYASKLSRLAGASPRTSMNLSLALGSAQAGASFHNAILQNGGSSAEAAAAFYAFGAVTYGANLLLSANMAQRLGLRGAGTLLRKNSKRLGDAASKAYKKPIGALSPQSKEAVTTAMATDGAEKVAKMSLLDKAGNLRGKASAAIENFSEWAPGGVPVGFASAMAGEEFAEEAIEELVHTPMENFYNKHFANPRAKEVVRHLSKFRYGVDYDEYGNPIYNKIDQDGNLSVIPWNVWQEEQKDLQTSQGILNGEYPFDGKFSWEEPFAALISSFVGGIPIFYMGGGHKARKANDEALFRQNIALAIAKHRPERRLKMLNEIDQELKRQQKQSGIFGPDYLRPDGTVISKQDATADDLSVAEIARQTFLNDLKMDIENYDRFHRDSPNLLVAFRNNRYLYHEAFDVVGKINEVQLALQALEKGEPMELGSHVAEGDTKEVLEKRLEGLQKDYEKIVMPKDGKNGKNPSHRYSEILMDAAYTDYLVKPLAEERVEENWLRQNKKRTEDEAGFDKAVQREMKKVRESDTDMAVLAWLKRPEKLRKSLPNHHQYSVYGVLNFVYKDMLGQEMQSMAKSYNEEISQAKKGYENFDQLVEQFRQDVDSFQKLDNAKYSGEVGAEAWKEFNKYSAQIQSLIDQADALSKIGRYNNLLSSQASQLSSAFDTLAEKIGAVSSDIDVALDYEGKMVDDPEAITFPEPGADLLAFYGGLQNVVNSASVLSGQMPAFERSEQIPFLDKEKTTLDFSKESPELVSRFRKEAIMRFLEGTQQTNISEEGTRRTIPVSQHIKDLVEKLKDPNYTVDEEEQREIIELLNNVQAIDGLVGESVDANVNFIQELKGSDAVHSMLNDGRSEHLKITAAENAEIQEFIKNRAGQVQELLSNKRLEGFSRDMEQTRDYTRNLALKYYFLKDAEVYNIKKDNEFGSEFATAVDELHRLIDANQGDDFFENLFRGYKADASPELKERKEIKKKLYQIEKAIIKVEETLSGKLDKYIVYVRGISENRSRFNDLEELKSTLPIIRGGDGIRGGMTVDGFKNLDDKKELASNLKYFLLTNAVTINRFGQKPTPTERGFTISEFLQAYREVLKRRNIEGTKEENDTSPDAIINGERFNVTTYAQEQLVLQIASFILNPKYSSSLHTEEDYQNLLKNSVYVRGFAGTGKTSQVMIDMISVIEELTGKKQFITVVVPTAALKSSHQDNFRMLNKVAEKDYNIIYNHELTSGRKDASGIVIFDEGSLWDFDDIEKIKESVSQNVTLWLGDDAQTPPLNSMRTMLEPPIKRFAAERTMPITEVFRSGNKQLHSVQDFFRKMLLSQYSNNLPTLTYEINSETGLMKGGIYYKNADDIRQSFIKQFDMLPAGMKHTGEIIYVVPTIQNRNIFLAWIESAYGKEKRNEIQPFVFTAEYENEPNNTCVSGITSERVFFEFDQNAFVNEQFRSDLGGTVTLGVDGIGAVYTAAVSRVGLTGSSRAKSFLALIGDPEKSQSGKVLESLSVKSNTQLIEENDFAIERLAYLTDDKTTYRKGGAGPIDPPGPDVADIDRNILVTPETRKEIAKSNDFKKLKESLQTLNRKLVEKNRSENIPVTHASELAMLSNTVKNAEKDPAYANQRQERRLKNHYFVEAIRYLLTNDSRHQAAAMAIIGQLNEHYQKVHKDNAEALERSIVKMPANYFAKTLTELQLPFESIQGDDLAISGPTLTNTEVKVKLPTGDTDIVTLEGNPAIIRVVGYAKSGNKSIPIVDIEDFVIHSSHSSFTSEAGPYTRAKIATYVLMAKQAGMRVNKVTLNNYLVNGATIQYVGFHDMTDQEIIEGVQEALPNVFIDEKIQPEAESLLATQEDLLQNEHEVNHEVYKPWHYFVNETTGEIVKIDRVGRYGKNDQVNNNVYFTQGKKGKKIYKLSEETFAAKYIPIQSSEKFFDGYRHKHRAQVFLHGTQHTGIKNAIQGSTLIVPTAINAEGQYADKILNHPAYKAKEALLGRLASTYNLQINKVYNRTFKNTTYNPKTKKFGYGDFDHVITNELTDDFLSAEIDLVKDTLIKADIIKSGSKLGKEKLIALFKENRFHIIGMDNVPEYTFRTKENNEISLIPFIDKYIAAEPGSVAETDAIKEIKQRMEEGFKDDKAFKNQLITYNIAKLIQLKHVKNNGSVVARIADVEIGNVLDGEEKITATKLIEKLKGKGFVLSTPKLSNDRKASGKAYFYVEARRPGYPGSLQIEFDAVSANVDDINEYIGELNDIWSNDARVIDAMNEIDNIFGETEKGTELTAEQARRLKNAARAAKAVLETTSAYQFLRSNQAALRTIYDELQNIARDAELDIDGEKIRATGNLFYFKGRHGLEVSGSHARQKYLNLFSVMKAVETYMSKTKRVADKDVIWRKNPFYVLFDKGGVNMSITKDDANPDLLETTIQDIKTPELYTIVDNFSEGLQESVARLGVERSQTSEPGNPGTNFDSNPIEDSLFNDDLEADEEPTGDDPGPGLKKIADGEISLDNAITIPEAVNQVNSLIGEVNTELALNIRSFEIKNKRDQALFGRMVSGLIELSGYNIDNQNYVQKDAPRHETMHFIMNYMLDYKTHEKVLDGIKKELGDAYVEGDIRQLYEYAADLFETMTEVRKPKNIFQKLIYGLKRIAVRLGAYQWTFREMLSEANRGYFRNKSVYSVANYDFDALEKNKDVDKYADPEKLREVIDTFGGYSLYSYFRDYVVLQNFKSYLPFGKSLLKTGSTVDEAIFRTGKYFQNKRVYTPKGQEPLAYRRHEIDGSFVSVREMTKAQFLRARATKDLKAYEDYINYQLSFVDNVMIILKDALPDINISRARSNGSSLYYEKGGKEKSTNTSAAKNIHSDAEKQSMSERMPNVMNLVLSSVPLYEFHGKSVYLESKKRFVPKRHVEKVFIDSVQRIQSNKSEYIRELYLNEPFPDITPDLLFAEMEHYALNQVYDSYIRDVYLSVVHEFGDKAIPFLKDGTYYYHAGNGERKLVGYLAIINNPALYGGNWQQNQTDFTEKVGPMRDMLSGIISHYSSLTVRKIGLVNIETGKFETKSNNIKTVVKSRIRDTIRSKAFGDDGLAHDHVAAKLKDGGSDQVIKVSMDGFSVVQENRSNLISYKNRSYLKKIRSKNFGLFENMYKNVPKEFVEVYDRNRKMKNLDVGAIETIFNFFGIYNYPKAILTSAFENKNKDGKYSAFNILHRFLMATKVNAEMTRLISEEVEFIEKLVENNPEADEYSILEEVLRKMDVDTRMMYEFIMQTDYGISSGVSVGSSAATNKIDTYFEFKDWKQKIAIPSPVDYFDFTEKIAEMIADASTDDVLMSRTAEGENTFSQVPGARVSDMTFGSELYVGKKTKELIPAFYDETKANHPLLDKRSNKPRFNNPLLNLKMSFDEAYEFNGITNSFRGKNFRDNTERDLSVAILEAFFADGVLQERSWTRVNLLMTPFADKSKAFVLPLFFHKDGTNLKETESIITIKRNAGNITGIEVNESLFVNNFSDIVEYYRKRRDKSFAKFNNTLGLTDAKVIKTVSDGKFSLEATPEMLAKVKMELEEFRDYIIKREGDKSFILPGHGVTLDNTIFNSGFIEAWDKSADVFTKYNLLRSAVSEDFLDWMYRIKKSDALGLLQKSGRNIPVEFFSTFEEIKIEDLVSERGDFTVLENAGKTINPEMIGSLVRENILSERNQWLSTRYKKDGTRAAEGETGFEPMTMADYSLLKPWLADEMYTEMSNDAELTAKIKDIREQNKKLKRKYTAKSIKLMTDVKWPPALEALYMSYLLGNEAIAHLERQDITLFDNPGQYIKRGSGLSAPGNVFDLSNPRGISRTAEVAVMEDIAGFNRFLGIEPNDPRGRKMFTDGFSLMNPVFLELLKRSSGGDFGVIGDFANKTVLYGYDAFEDKSFYFKFSQLPIDATHFRNSEFHRAFMQRMLGEYFPVFEDYLNETEDFDKAVKLMADFVVDPANAGPDGLLPRDKMIGYVIHGSDFKQGLTGVNQYAYDGEDIKSAYNVLVPDNIQTLTVPNKFLRLQVVNNGDGHINLHSFATQLFSILGVGENNQSYMKQFNDALIYKSDQFTAEINKITDDAIAEGRDPKKDIVKFVKDVIRKNAGRSIKGSKLESLLNDNQIVGEVLGNKAFESLVSYMNEHLKPSVPGSNYVQQPEFMKVYQNLKTGAVYLSGDLGLENDLADAEGHMRRLLRPLTYFDKGSKMAFESKEELEARLKNNPGSVVAVPAEVIMQFHYADRFGIPRGVSLQSIFAMKNGFSFYETGFQRAAGENAKSVDDVISLILSQITEGMTFQQFINSFSGGWMQAKIYQMLKNRAREVVHKENEEGVEITKERIEDFTLALMNAPVSKDSAVIRDLASFYFDLNNALDVMMVRIPTTNASSGSIGRIVAFSDTGNSIFTSAEKSILDGSDYDHDELHVFYPSLWGRKINVQKLSEPLEKQSNKSFKNFNESANNNQMFYAIHQFYSDPRNHVFTLSPIDLTSLKDWVKENASEEDSSPNVANSVNHNIYSSMINFAGVNLVGHFANQMSFTNRLISQIPAELEATVNPRLQGVMASERYPEILDFIAKLVNAAVDNATLNGLLGQLNINNAVTPLIAGMVLHAVPETITIIKGKGKNATTEEIQKNLEEQVIEMLQDKVVQRAARVVIASQSLRSKGRQTKIWEALLKHRKDVSKPSLVEKIDRFRSYAHAGEQLNRLGNLYKITQEFEGSKPDAVRMIYNIERALGENIEDFINQGNLDRLKKIDYANEKAASDYVNEQIDNLKSDYFFEHEQEGESIGEEFNIRMMINIGRIVANNPLIVSQLRAIAAFRSAISAVDFSMGHPEIKSAIMKKIGRPELLFETGHNDYENSIKKLLIGTFMQRHGNSNLALQYFDPDNQFDEVLRIFDLTDAQEQMRFVIHFSEYVNALKKKYPEIDFLKRIEFERFGRNPIPIANFRNSIYIEPGEKAFYQQSFKDLAKKTPAAAEAFRNYQLLVYGFTFRNGTFSEVIDNVLEKQFSEAYPDIESNIAARLISPIERDNLLAEIAFNADQILPYFYSEEKVTSEFYKMVNSNDDTETMFMKIDPEKAEGMYKNNADGVIVNYIFPKELYIMAPGKGITTDFVFRDLSKEQLLKLHYEGSVTKVAAGNINARKRAPGKDARIENIPYSGRNIRTLLNDVARIDVKSINRASFTRLRDKDNPAESRITMNGSAVTSHGIDVLMNVVQRRFRGINFEFVDNGTSMTDGIAYVHQGTVYINKDKIQVDTFFHEITHVLLPIIKEMNPSQYNALYDDAMRMIEESDPVVDIIRDNYKSLHGHDLVDEIIATVTGWTTMEKVQDYLAIHNLPWYQRGASYYWNKFKARVKNFWNSIRSVFKGYQLNIDPETATIRDFAADVVSRALSGQNVLKIDQLQLKNLSRTAYEQVYEQRTEPISTSRDLYDHLMNTGEIKQGDKTVTITQHRDLNRDEKIQSFIDKIPQKKYVHMTRSGEVIRFDPKRPDTWRAIIEEKVLNETDTNALEIKRKVLKAFARKDFSPRVLQASFGINENGKPRVADKAIDKFLRQVRYHPKHKIMLYSDLPGTKYEYMYDKDLEGFDPIINIEYESEDQIIVSIFNITNDSIFARDKLAPYEKRNILNRYFTDASASRRNITMKSNVGDASNLLLGLIAGKISNTNKKVYIHQAGTISLNPKDSHIDLMFGIDLKSNIQSMLDSHEFRADLAPNILSYLEKFTAISNGFDYQSVLFNKYEDMNYGKSEIDAFKNGSLDYHAKKRVFMARLAALSKKAGEGEISVDEALEIDLLFKAIGNFNGALHISDQINSKSDLKAFEKYASPQFDVGHELIDVIRRATLQTSQQTVKQIKDFKDKIDDFAEYFRARYIQKHGAIDERIRDVTGKYYNEILAMVTDRNGVKRFAGSILWTTDKEQDPLFYEQAQRLDPELLKWGEFVVNEITEQMIDNFLHKRIREHGLYVMKNNVPTEYTREMAEKDLFIQTTYRKGMLPLMQDTVGQLISRGQIGKAWKTKRTQIESSFVEFEEIGSLSDKEADVLDGMPDMFMAQFANTLQEFEVGSLGLTDKRMYKFLGLVEDKGEYIYDEVSDRGTNLNTDLETLMEFFKLSSLRKINYENNVLPLVNGAKLYMTDLQTNQEYKQKNAIEYLDLFVNQSILGKRKKANLSMGGINVEPLVIASMGIVSPLVMAGNVNVMAVSAIHNFMMAFIEGTINTIYDAMNPEEKRHWATVKEFTQASGIVLTDFHKVSQLMRDFQLINPNEYEMVVHRHNQKRKKHVFSDYHAQWMNWSADYYARGVVMVAQMLKDGSYYAYTYNRKTGKVEYDPRKDRQYYDNNGQQDKKQEVLYSALKERLQNQDIGLNEKGEASVGYSYEQMRAFKGFADKYIVGAYGPLEKNIMTQFLLGKMAMMFTTWFMTKVSNAFKTGSWLDEVGYFDIYEDGKGNLIPYWQREWTEGYLTTVLKMTFSLIRDGDVKQFKNMKPHEKYNWIKSALTTATFFSGYLMYAFVFGLWEDRLSWLKDEEEGEEVAHFWKAKVKETRLRKNILYAIASLSVWATILEKLDSPFAVPGIIRRMFTQGLDLAGAKWENLKYVVPFANGYFTTRDEVGAYLNNDD